MDYLFKFGALGSLEGQFAEPRGLAVNAENEIIVADTNNHRIQIFDGLGHFQLQFGGYGQGNGLLMYPYRVAVSRANGDIIVLQESPNHQFQIFNMLGHFITTGGENLSSVTEAVTVDSEGRIIVVDCSWVHFFDEFGAVLNEFNFAHSLETPNGVVASDKKEIFICDLTTHCVKVFNYDGQCCRQIGGDSITKHPFGVGLASLGAVVIGKKTEEYLSLLFFGQDGALMSKKKSKAKHAVCFDLATMDDGVVVVSCNDNCLYVYR